MTRPFVIISITLHTLLACGALDASEQKPQDQGQGATLAAEFIKAMATRASRVSNVRYKLSGESFFRKACFSNDWQASSERDWIRLGKPTFPAEDHRSPATMTCVFDFQGNRLRREMTGPVPKQDDEALAYYFCDCNHVVLFDGAKAQWHRIRSKTAPFRNCMNELDQDLTHLMGTSLEILVGGIENLGLCLVHGRFELPIGSSAKPQPPPTVTWVATANAAGAKCEVFRQVTGPILSREYWVDLASEGAIKRVSYLSQDVETQRLECDYETQDGKPRLTKLRAMMFDERGGVKESREWKVDEFVENQSYEVSAFHVEEQPGMIVIDSGAKGGQVHYRVEPNGSRRNIKSILQERRSVAVNANGLTGWRLVLAINGLFAVGAVIWWIAKRRTALGAS